MANNSSEECTRPDRVDARPWSTGVRYPALRVLEAAAVLLGMTVFTLAQVGVLANGFVALTLVLFFSCSVRKGGTLAWLLVALGMNVFLVLRAHADTMGFPLHTEDLQRLEVFLFVGAYPSQLLQTWFFRPEQPGLTDYVALGIYMSYFVVPYLVLYVVWLVRPQLAFRFSFLLVCTLLLGVVGYALLPATPPWLASRHPGLAHVWRITSLVGQRVSPEAYGEIYSRIGDPNPTAAVPSLHFAITFMVYLFARGARRWWRALAGAYVIVMAFTLVYLGEHYVVDLILGGILAWLVWRFGSRHADTVARAIGERPGPSLFGAHQ
jgi:membrane-associated phospholipid phosphatase